RVEADEGLSRRTAVSTLNPRGLRAIAVAPKLAAAQRTALEEAAKHLTDAEARESLLPKRRADLDELVQDLGRLRGYLAATRSKNDAEKFTSQILEKEARVKELRTRIASLGTEAEGYRGRARTALGKLHR
ncbi:MAG TPA: hypothetical protein VM694_40765, partial [Polyangium sp.]|nr:hypothetical protein [Polyangium sp.]